MPVRPAPSPAAAAAEPLQAPRATPRPVRPAAHRGRAARGRLQTPNPSQGIGEVLAELERSHLEYPRSEHRPLLFAASEGAQRAYALVEGRYQDVGALPGHPAPFRVTTVYHIFAQEAGGGGGGAAAGVAAPASLHLASTRKFRSGAAGPCHGSHRCLQLSPNHPSAFEDSFSPT